MLGLSEAVMPREKQSNSLEVVLFWEQHNMEYLITNSYTTPFKTFEI